MAYVFEKVAHNVISTYSLSENLIQANFSNLTIEFQFLQPFRFYSVAYRFWCHESVFPHCLTLPKKDN